MTSACEAGCEVCSWVRVVFEATKLIIAALDGRYSNLIFALSLQEWLVRLIILFMDSYRVEAGGQNTLVLRDSNGNIIMGGWFEGEGLAGKIRSATGECGRCQVKGHLCGGLKWVSGTGVFHQSQHSTVGADYCPMRGKEYGINL